MAGLGAAALAPVLALGRGRPRRGRRWRCRPKPTSSRLRPGSAGYADLVAWHGPDFRFKRGETLEVTLRQRTAGARGPQLARDRWRPGRRTADRPARRWRQAAKETLQLPLRHAGTFLCDLRLLGDGQARPSRARALIVRESEPVAVDRDEVLLIEDWRLRPDGTAIAPGHRSQGRRAGLHDQRPTSLDLSARTNERLRLRFINGCQRAVIAVKIGRPRGSGHGHRRPAGRAVPGPQRRAGAGAGRPGRRFRRCDSAGGHRPHDPAARRQGGPPDRHAGRLQASRRSAPPRCRRPPPLPSNGLPAQLDLKNATAGRSRARRTAGRLGDAGELHRHRRRPPSAPRPAASWCWP